jgi:hypothetical protein
VLVRPYSRATVHDCNNLLQAAISGLELIQIRTEQGRASEIVPLIKKVHCALIRVADLTSRHSILRGETPEIGLPHDGASL